MENTRQPIPLRIRQHLRDAVGRMHPSVSFVSCIGVLLAYLTGVYITGSLHEASRWMGAMLACTSLMPSVEEIYPEPDGRQFDFGQIDKVMEGATRPGHFNGVAQVVSRLFDIVRPARAYFGEKDFQQIAVVKAMVDQLSLPVEIVECEIVRGEDGLALSSRNALLDAEHRAAAPQIYAALRAAAEKSQELAPEALKAWVTAEVERNPLLKVIYYQSVDARTMQEVAAWSDAERIQGCIAVQAGDIRLIDNIRIR